MILSVLKIIGIVLLIIVAVLILVLGIILFVPIRYQFAGEYENELKATGVVKWSPIFLKVTAEYQDDKKEYIVRMFGGVVKTNTDIPLSWIGRKFFSSEDGSDEEIESQTHLVNADTAKMQDNAVWEENEYDDLEKKKQSDVRKKETYNKKQSIFMRIRKWIKNIKRKIKEFIDKVKKINQKKEALIKVYHSKRFEVAKKDAIIYLKELIRIIKPRKAEGYIHFGLEDPATTGQILGVVAMFIPLYDDFLQVYPDFEHACLEGDLKGRGKIYLFSVIKLAIKIFFNKNLIKVIKKVQTIIEA